MGHLAKDALLLVWIWVFFRHNQVFAIVDTAHVSCGNRVVVRTEDCVQLIERVREVEHLLVVPEGGLGDLEPFLLDSL